MLPRFLTLVAALLAAVAAIGATAAASSPGMFWAAAAGVAIIAVTRPAVGLMLVAAFAPLGGAIAALWGLSTSATEPLLLSVVAGWLLRRTLRPESWDATAVSLAGLLAMTVCASLAVQCAVAFQIAAPSGLGVPRALLQWLTQSSQVHGPLRPEVPAALRLLGGCGLFAMAVEVCRRQPLTASASLRLLALSVTAVAALNINRFIEVALRQGTDFWPAARHVHQFLRVSSTIPDVNAVGALFALVLPSAAWLCLATARRGWLWGVVSLVLGAGLWLSGSRAAMTGGVIGVVGYLALFGYRHWTWRRTVATWTVVLAAVTALVFWYPRAAAHTTSHNAWLIRQQMAKVGFQMAREAPLFGIGVGRFFEESARLASPELRRYYSAQNAHNQFIQFLGELGTLGAGLFVAIIGWSVIPGWRKSEPQSSAVWIRPMIAGIVGFLVACILMHPLLLPEVAAAFWLALGVARSTVIASAIDNRPSRAAVLAPALLALALLASLPTRTTATQNALDLGGAGLGLSAWRSDRDGRPFRRAAGDAAIFVDGRESRVRVPLRVRGRRGTEVDLSLLLDGRPAGRMRVRAGPWTEMTLQLPAHRHDRPNFQRLELHWSSVTSRAQLHVGQVEYPGRRAP